ncbi:MAG TPA: hypothetical protein VF532_25040 [Candidatus Angelobacter sp.]
MAPKDNTLGSTACNLAHEPLSPVANVEHDFELPGGHNDDALTRGLLADAIKHSGKSREQIAGCMSFLLATTVTAETLNNFSVEGRPAHGFPLAWTRAFCTVTGDWRLIQHLAEQAGFLLLANGDADLVSLGELVVQQERARREVERHANNIIARRDE